MHLPPMLFNRVQRAKHRSKGFEISKRKPAFFDILLMLHVLQPMQTIYDAISLLRYPKQRKAMKF
jgi:hypothetical protein